MQCAWLLLLHCAAPRSNYTALTLPPMQSQFYAHGHDAGVWGSFTILLGRGDLLQSTYHANMASPLFRTFFRCFFPPRSRPSPEGSRDAFWSRKSPKISQNQQKINDKSIENLPQNSSRGEEFRKKFLQRPCTKSCRHPGLPHPHAQTLRVRRSRASVLNIYIYII